MLSNPNCIYIRRSDFDSKKALYKSIAKNIEFLLENDNMVCISEITQEDGLFQITFAPRDSRLSTLSPVWLDAEYIQKLAQFTYSISYFWSGMCQV